MTEQEIRKTVKALKGLYLDIFSYLSVNALLILVWLIFDRNEVFWPKYVLLIWGLVLTYKAYQTGLLALFYSRLAFLSPEWEEQKINEIIGRGNTQRKIQLNRHIKR